jgi:diaminopimelate decarboxylase
VNSNRSIFDPPTQPQTVDQVVSGFIRQRELYLELAKGYGSPLYLIDEAALLARVEEFQAAFKAHQPAIQLFFPVKTNSHPLVIQTMVKAGIGIEASSGLELQLALACGASEILLNGPGKTDDELNLALRHWSTVTLILDSAAEFDRLDALASHAGVTIRAGIRLSVANSGLWRKFGIPLDQLQPVMEKGRRSRHIRLQGLHFHTSWNMDPSAQVKSLARIGQVLERLPPELKKQLVFIDIGGGFWPPQGEWRPADSSQIFLQGGEAGSGPFYSTVPAVPITEFARQISEALKTHIFPHVQLQLYAEPGRWLCTDGLHLLMTVVDLKGDDIAITDAGTNAIGWERFESEYFPVINLSQPGEAEQPFLVLGSLCTPHDLWGCSYFGAGMAPGDILLIPMQGAYTYSLRQQFIKPLPGTLFIPAALDAALVFS